MIPSILFLATLVFLLALAFGCVGDRLCAQEQYEDAGDNLHMVATIGLLIFLVALAACGIMSTIKVCAHGLEWSF